MMLFTLFLLLLFNYSIADSAWNGLTPIGSDVPSKFTPFYVAPGTTAFDSDSPQITYTGQWNSDYSKLYYNRTAHSSSTKNASALFHFSGSGIEWYGAVGNTHGSALVYLDRALSQKIVTWASKGYQQQLLFFDYTLSYAPHTLQIVNCPSNQGSLVDIDAFVVVTAPLDTASTVLTTTLDAQSPSQWSLSQNGSTGVSAMQLSIISPTHAIIIDKVEHNPLTLDGHPAWGALFSLVDHSVKPLSMQSNSFCAGGSFLSNGTLINVGGNPVVSSNTSSADFGDLDGLQAIRLFHPCTSPSIDHCDIYENHARIRMASPRWYSTVLRISDGSAMIIGGSKKGGWINNATVNNPTIEYYPPKNIANSNGLPIPFPFLSDTLNANLFPIAFHLPTGKVFIAANQDATLYDWKSNTEQRLPKIPNGVRVTYPMTAVGLLLPLSPSNNYTSEILLCGGSSLDDSTPGYELSSQDPASSQCASMVLTEEGIANGWQTEQMPQARIMPDAVILPTGQILIINGGATGISGYGNVIDQIGASNADNPVLTPVLYDPSAPVGSRFSTEALPTSDIPRLYHSVASLTPMGNVIVAGSNPNLDRSEVRYGTEYRVEWLDPPYMLAVVERPALVRSSSLPEKIGFGASFDVEVGAGAGVWDNISVACMDLGFVTHAVHANSRLVFLENSVVDSDLKSNSKTIRITAPPNADIYPPGPAWIYILVDGIPSVGYMLLIGDGKGPPVDSAALENLLKMTEVDQYDKSKDGKSDDDDGE